MQTGLTTMVSVSENGVAANNGVAGQGIYSLAISGDGRFLAFSSPSTNLVSAATDGVSTHLFLRDVLLQNTSLVDSDQTGNPFGVRAMNALYPSISSDGRFVTYQGYGQVFIRDMTSNQSRALSLASDGTVGNASSGGPVISPGGSIIAFGSAASNLISGDTNAVSDAFVVQNPLLEMPYPVSITLQLPQGGNSPGTGVVTLSGTAPASGSSVVLSSDCLLYTSYMNEVGAGHEVTILITLATPHHGSPAALLDSRDALAGPTWSKWFHLVDKSLFGWTSDLVVDGFGPNRSDLSWDNFDGSFSPNGADINTWLAHLNGIEIYQSKIHAYYGYIDPDSPDRIQEAQHLGSWFGVPWITHLNAAHSAGNSTEQDRITGIGLDYGLDHIYAYNDGIVPIESGFFKNANVKMFACEGFSHSEFFRKLDEDCVSSGTTDTLFDFLMSDLGLAVPPPTPAGLVVLSVLDSLFSGVSLNVAADQVVQLLNASQFPVQISGISLQGGGGSFALTPSSNSPFTLDPGQSQPVLTTFRPTAAGNTSATISVTHNASNGPTTQISLSGTGATTGGGACGGGTSQGYSVGGAPPVHPVGTFVKVLNDPTVYLIQAEDVHSSNVHADAIANPTALFNPYNQSVSGDQFAFENIITIDSDEMDSYSVLGTISIAKFYPGNGMPQPEGTLIQASGSAEISIVTDNASRRPFPTQTVFLGLGYLYCNVLTVSSAVYNSYSTGPIIEGTGDDFSVQVNPISTSASQGDQATLLISTATTSGSPESITLTYGNLPTGTSLVFNPASVASGGSSTLTATAGVSTPPGIYTITILGIGSSFSHSVQISLTVTAASGGAASVSLAPPSLTFPAQTVLTPSTSQTITVKNTGTSSLTITSLTFAGAGDYGTINGPTFPVSVAAGATTAIQVYFEPHATGSSSALMYIWDNAPGSPQSVPLAGSGLAVPPTYGTIQVNEVINGVPGASYAVFSLTGPSTYYGDATGSFDVPPGTYTLAFTGQPSYLTLTSITPSVSQAVSAGGTAAFIMTCLLYTSRCV